MNSLEHVLGLDPRVGTKRLSENHGGKSAGVMRDAQKHRPKQKRRLLEGKRRFVLIVTHKEELLCPWQAWQRPTLPGLKP
jgi:hypothetical protein